MMILVFNIAVMARRSRVLLTSDDCNLEYMSFAQSYCNAHLAGLVGYELSNIA